MACVFEFRCTIRSKMVGVHFEREEDGVGVVVGLVPVGRRVCSERFREAGEGDVGRGGGLDEAVESVLNADGDGGADARYGITN